MDEVVWRWLHDLVIPVREKTERAKETFYAPKKPMKTWDVNVDNIVFPKLVKTKANSKYLTGYADKDLRSLVLVVPKMNRCVKTFKIVDKSKQSVISIYIMRNYRKNIKLFGLRLNT